MEVDPWRTSRFLPFIPGLAHSYPWRAPMPPSHLSFRGPFSHILWVLKSICSFFEGIQELVCYKSHPSPVPALGLKGQAPA